jgi:putative ABC transport system permease protein
LLDFWRIDALRNAPALENLGDGGFKLTGVAWMDAAPWSALQYTFSGSSIDTWFGVDPKALTASNVGEVQSQLTQFLARPPDPATRLRYATQLDDSLSEYVVGAGAAQTLLLMLAAGPLGVAVAVVALGIELLIERRRHVLALMSARGASALRIRGSLAVEGLVVSVPAVAIAALITLLALPGPADPSLIVSAIVCALLPPLILAALGSPLGSAGGRALGRWRWIAEVVVLAAAAVALLVLFQRGLTPPAGAIAADPLLVLTPVLLCLAVSVLVLRVVPYLLARLAAILRRRTGVLGFIGAVRGERTSAAALVPVLAVLVGVAVTVFSAVVFSTERTGVAEGARARVGSDISVSASRLSEAQVDRMRGVDGVAAVATVSSAGYANLSKDGTVDPVFVFETDSAALADVQSGLPVSERMPSLASSADHRAPVALGGWGDTGHAANGTLTLDSGIPVRVVTTTLAPGDFVTVAPWILVDAKAVPSDFSTDPPVVTTALIRLDPGVDSADAVARLQKIGGHDATIHSAAIQAAAARAAPIVGGLEVLLPIAIGLAVLLCVLALVLTLVMNGRNRERLTATLRTLGFSRRQNAALTAWEIGPIVAAGLVGGLAAGFLLPFIVLVPLDLAAFTGGSAHPPISIDGLTITIALVGFIAVCALVTVAALAISTRRNAASILRTGEDE